MQSEGLQATPLKGLFWLGTAGAVLILAGLSAVLSANWHWVPFGVQIALAVLPLVVGWIASGLYLFKHEGDSRAVEEVLGVIWSGGVICSVALLGRVLQLSSNMPLFLGTVFVLLLPVVWLLRSVLAWGIASAFATAFAITLADEVKEAGWGIVALLICGGVLFARVAPLWIKKTSASLWKAEMTRAERLSCLQDLATRWLASAVVCVFGLAMMVILLGLGRNTLCEDFGLFPLAIPLLLGVLLERRESTWWQPLTRLGTVLFGIASVPYLLHMPPDWWWSSFWISIVLLVLLGKWVLREEGVLLLMLPLASIPMEEPRLILAVGALILGSVLMVRGLMKGRRTLANEGLVFILWTVWIILIGQSGLLMMQGVLLMAGGLLLVVLNLIWSRVQRKRGGAQ